MNNTFSIKRFGMILRWNLLTNWRHYLNCIIGMAIGLSMITLTNIGSGTRLEEIGADWGLSDTDVMVHTLGNFFPFIAFIFCFAMTAYIFANMGTKLQRETFMLLPGSNAEKYLSRLLFATVGAVVQFGIAVVVADAVQALAGLFLHPDFHPSLTLATIKSIGQRPLIGIALGSDVICQVLLSQVSTAAALLFSSSFAVLGGTIFRKQPAVITCGIWLALIMGATYVLAQMLQAGVPAHMPVLDVSDMQWTVIAISAVVTIIAVINYWLSYRIFCRMQVVGNKWINL